MKKIFAVIVLVFVFGCGIEDEGNDDASSNPSDYSISMTCRYQDPTITIESSKKFSVAVCRVYNMSSGTVYYEYKGVSKVTTKFYLTCDGNLSHGKTVRTRCVLGNGVEIFSNTCYID